MERIILYYSDGGKTKVVAETLALNLRCDICQIKDMKKRDGIRNRLSSTIDAFRESKTDIVPAKVDLTEYDTIIFGTPTWAGNPTPAILTIIDRCNLTGKDVMLIATMDSSRGDTNIERLEEKVKMRGGRVIETFTIATKGKTRDKLIEDTEAIIDAKVLKMYTR